MGFQGKEIRRQELYKSAKKFFAQYPPIICFPALECLWNKEDKIFKIEKYKALQRFNWTAYDKEVWLEGKNSCSCFVKEQSSGSDLVYKNSQNILLVFVDKL